MDNKNLDLELFVDRLLQEKKFPENLEKEVMAQIKADLLDQVENRINAVIISNLTEDKLEEFNKKIDQNLSDEEMQKFFGDNIPDLTQLIASELISFRQSYLS
jgi:broad-specificity NMP kinase